MRPQHALLQPKTSLPRLSSREILSLIGVPFSVPTRQNILGTWRLRTKSLSASFLQQVVLEGFYCKCGFPLEPECTRPDCYRRALHCRQASRECTPVCDPRALERHKNHRFSLVLKPTRFPASQHPPLIPPLPRGKYLQCLRPPTTTLSMDLPRHWELPVPALPEGLRLETVSSLITFVSKSHSAKETPVTKSSLPQTELLPATSLKARIVLAPPHTQVSCLRMVNELSWLPTYHLTVPRKLWRPVLACKRRRS